MAQSGRVLGSGPRGRWFESSHSDDGITVKSLVIYFARLFLFFDKAAYFSALSKCPVTKDKVFGIKLIYRIFAGFKDIKNNFCDIY